VVWPRSRRGEAMSELFIKCPECENGWQEHDDGEQCTRDRCENCRGTGYVPAPVPESERWEAQYQDEYPYWGKVVHSITKETICAYFSHKAVASLLAEKHNASVARLQAQVDALTAQLAAAEAAMPEIGALFSGWSADSVREAERSYKNQCIERIREHREKYKEASDGPDGT